MSIDGQQHGEEMEIRLNDLAVSTFGTPSGQQFLNYLTNMTLNRAMPPGTPSETLQHIEGQRYLLAIIKMRFDQGRQQHDGRTAIDAGTQPSYGPAGAHPEPGPVGSSRRSPKRAGKRPN
jgi:hypothetical protein